MDISNIPITRRHFLLLGASATAPLFLGCAANPVTGKKQLMLISESDEKQIDRKHSPHQFSGDYGAVQDPQLSQYVGGVGKSIAKRSHRTDLPYRFVPLNATYVNAYTFPAGSVGITRGILLEMESEAALAALIGHELGHVSARHTAQQMSKSLLSSLALAGLTSVASDAGDKTGKLASGLGQLATGALLASYSRDNEREADSLALTYMVKAGYGPKGHTELMDMLRNLSKNKPSAIELMFSTHPMSDERYRDSLKSIAKLPASSRELPLHRERYMDNTAKLRSIGDAIDRMQRGERFLYGGKYGDAEGLFREALNLAPGDYAGLLLMAKCQLALEKPDISRKFARDASSAYPGEPQALHILGMCELSLKKYDEAYDHFQMYAKALPGNPNTLFYQGLSAEGMSKRDLAARHYKAYLNEVNRGEKAQYAYGRLKEWGYIK
jgi:X-X-X-Leu-X-X-Gly heptad repeat protein